MEELEKLKSKLASTGSNTKERIDTARTTADSLLTENKRLYKQKQDLASAFKKQAQLIEILKRQKLHIQAATLLEFREEEFMKILDNR